MLIDLQQFSGLTEQIEVDTSEQRRSYLLIGPDGRHLRLSASAYYILRGIHEGHTYAELAEQLSQRQGQLITPGAVEDAYQHLSQRLAVIDQRRSLKRSGFWFRFPLLPSAVVAAIARPLSIAFRPELALVLVGIIMLAATFFFVQYGLFFHFGAASFGLGYLLFVLSLVAHEFGHASACARYSLSPGEIGFTTYWIYPAFYSDVSSAWRLKRWQRVVVDLGGVFFQLVVGAAYVLLYLLSGWEPARVAVYMILYSVLFSFNPILKFDGYWVVADALGVTNLAQQPIRIARYIWDRLRGRSPASLPWPGWISWLLGVYSAVSCVFWGYFLWRLFPFVWKTIAEYPFLVEQLLHGDTEPLTIRLLSFLMSTFVASLVIVLLANLANMVFRPLIVQVARFVHISRTYPS